MKNECLFSFMGLQQKELVTMGEYIEENLFSDPHLVLIKARVYAETLAKIVMDHEKLEEIYEHKQAERTYKLFREGIIREETYQQFEWIRKMGNKAAHEPDFGTVEDALRCHRYLYEISVWYQETYGDYQFQAPIYCLPQVKSSHSVNPEALNRLISQTVQQTLDKTLHQTLGMMQQELLKVKALQEMAPPQTKESMSSYVEAVQEFKEDPSFNLVSYLTNKGIEVIDKRPNGGALWVVGGWELNEILFPLKEKKIYFRFSKNGGRSTKKRPAWFLLGKKKDV